MKNVRAVEMVSQSTHRQQLYSISENGKLLRCLFSVLPLQHCHVYEHAERGMLGFIAINGGYGPSGEP